MQFARWVAISIVFAVVAAACTSGSSTLETALSQAPPVATDTPSAAPAEALLDDFDLSDLSVTIGSKDFTEQEVLGQIFIQSLAAVGADVENRLRLGGTGAVRQSLLDGAIDLYPEYNGTCWTVHLGRSGPPTDGVELTQECAAAEAENGVAYLGRAPLNDTYGIASSVAVAGSYQTFDLQAMMDRAAADPDSDVCMGPEFAERPDGLALLEAATGQQVPDEQIVVLDNASIYRETAASRCEYGVVFTTDGRIRALDLVLMRDPGVFIVYNPSMAVRSDVAGANPQLQRIAELVLAPIDDETITDLNSRVTVEGETAAAVARSYLVAQGFVAADAAIVAGSEPSTSDAVTELDPGGAFVAAEAMMDAGPEATNNIIEQLQLDLQEMGLYEGAIDGLFGPSTEESVRRFQQIVDLPVDGRYGPETAGAIGVILGRADRQSTRALQEALVVLGLYDGAVDGRYGDSTQEAIAALQAEAGLEPNGVYDRETAQALVALYEEREPEPISEMSGPEETDDDGDGIIETAEGLVLKQGAESEDVRLLQLKLAEMGYRPGTPDGQYGAATAAAVMAFQKHEGLQRDGSAGPQVFAALEDPQGAGPRGCTAPCFEVDIVRQIAFVLLEDGSVTILNVSTGNNEPYIDSSGNEAIAYTPVGEFEIERRINGLREAPLGTLYWPLYFLQGWALHGSASVPGYPASHGCVRTHNWDQDWLVESVEDGTTVFIYDDLRGSDEIAPTDGSAGF